MALHITARPRTTSRMASALEKRAVSPIDWTVFCPIRYDDAYVARVPSP